MPPRSDRSQRRASIAAGAAALVFTAAATAGDAAEISTVTFDRYYGDATVAELTRRLVSPLGAALEHGEDPLRDRHQLVDLAGERFLLRVPARRPGGGYGLIVFVPPWADARLPAGWGAVLDGAGLIFASAAHSGNGAPVMARREPLALLAARNVLDRFPVDPARVYVAGFSGGSRIALRLALGYPDLFTGVLLNAGSDEIGSVDLPMPPRDLWLRFARNTRVVFLTGERDTEHANEDQLSLRALHRWCVRRIESYTEPRVDHRVASPTSLARGVASLDRASVSSPDHFAACEAAVDAEVEARARDVERALAAGQREKARSALALLDSAFGGVAGDRIAGLRSRL